MRSGTLSAFDKVQLILLRCLSATLVLVDTLFNVRWGERLLDRLTDRWQAELVRLDRAVARLEEERHQLNLLIEATAIHAAVIYLLGRHQTHAALRFDPSDPHDERVLDASIDLLVKEGLAAIETEEIEPERYVYYLEPDWRTIRERLACAAERAEPELADWLREGVSLIVEQIVEAPGDQA